MRSIGPTSLLAITLFATACGGASTRQPAQRASIPCEIAAAYAETVINEAKGRPLVFSTDDGSFDSPLSGGAWWKTSGGERPQSATPPPAALVSRLQAQGNINAVPRCASVRKLLDDRHIGYGSKAVDAVNSSDPSVTFKASIETISMPVVSVDGKLALLASSGVSGPLAGGGFLQFLKRQAGGSWKTVGSSPLWVA